MVRPFKLTVEQQYSTWAAFMLKLRHLQHDN